MNPAEVHAMAEGLKDERGITGTLARACLELLQRNQVLESALINLARQKEKP